MGSARPLNGNEHLPDAEKLGPVIREMREERRMSPEELARLAGVDAKSVEHWEKGRRVISNSSLPRVARALASKPSAMWARAEVR